MKVKIFEIVLHKLPSGKSPASALEERLNEFLTQHPDLQLVTTQMSTLVAPAEPNAMPRSEESSIMIFCALFYTDQADTEPNTATNAGTREPAAFCDTRMMPAYEPQSVLGKSSGAA